MNKRPFIENPHYRDANQDIENHTNAQPAILSTQEPGVAVTLGRFKVCLSRNGAYRLAESIISSLETNSKGNQK